MGLSKNQQVSVQKQGSPKQVWLERWCKCPRLHLLLKIALHLSHYPKTNYDKCPFYFFVYSAVHFEKMKPRQQYRWQLTANPYRRLVLNLPNVWQNLRTLPKVGPQRFIFV